MAKVNRLTATFHFNGFCLNLDGKPMSCKEVTESDYIHSFDDRIMILLAFDKAVKEHGITYRNTYESGLIQFLDNIKDVCKKPTNNKWLYEIIVQEYVCGYGWTDACAELSIKAAIMTKKDYIKEGINARIINRRTLNPDYVPKVKA